ncbi:Xaa-Pro aminopeptidase [Jatrophihabitans endophyticus]|uniref:Xaa-Pro aminopeptidase n=1 Tax=Jatrophihabitans endophyticus TaxID=1206085 RepID=A0A1M5PHR2_9ACTN|nr:aminopeptidase P family protein [Jatrophihabitans endophyticus]SHH01287.1 Xaa-Pro aminopeptidase [Jatrophihabitans endophyticus]
MANIGREELAGAHDASVPKAFADLMTQGWRERDVDTTPVPHATHLARRRARLSTAFPGETLVVPTGAVRWRTFGAPYPFRAGSDLLWLTGDHDPDSVLVLHPTATGHDAVLYVRPRSDPSSGLQYLDRVDGEVWHGRRLSPAEKELRLQVPTAPLADLPGAIGAVVAARRAVRVLRGYDAGIDTALLPVTPDNAERDALLASVLSELRLVKDEWELAQLQDAVDATVLGFEDVARRLAPDVPTPERLVDGAFAWRARVNGNAVGYSSVVGGGERTAILHWAHNDGVVRPGQTLLLDMGVENDHGYTADVTRVLPVSGTFGTAQRDVYDIVYASRCAGLAAVAPGVAFREVQLTCMRVLAEGLSALGILPGSVDEAMDPERTTYRRWTLHGFGHMLGLDVHDCGHARPEAYGDGVLAENHVLTMEPGLYLQPHDELVPAELRGIGVRIEDDVLVTATGNQVLSAALPTRADEVERWLADQRQAGPRAPSRDDVVG